MLRDGNLKRLIYNPLTALALFWSCGASCMAKLSSFNTEDLCIVYSGNKPDGYNFLDLETDLLHDNIIPNRNLETEHLSNGSSFRNDMFKGSRMKATLETRTAPRSVPPTNFGADEHVKSIYQFEIYNSEQDTGTGVTSEIKSDVMECFPTAEVNYDVGQGIVPSIADFAKMECQSGAKITTSETYQEPVEVMYSIDVGCIPEPVEMETFEYREDGEIFSQAVIEEQNGYSIGTGLIPEMITPDCVEETPSQVYHMENGAVAGITSRL